MGGYAAGSTASGWSGLPSTSSRLQSMCAPDVRLAVLPLMIPVRIDTDHGLHPFIVNRFDAGPVQLASIAHAFIYRCAMLWDGPRPAIRTAHSRKAERVFLGDISLPWGQQLAVMFQILSALVLDVPDAADCLSSVYGISPDVILAFEPWGHSDHTGTECGCRSSDCTGAYVHAIAYDRPTSLPGVGLLVQPQSVHNEVLPDESTASLPGPTSCDGVCDGVWPGAIPFVSNRAGVYSRLLLATYERMLSGGLAACDWLTSVTRGAWHWAPPISVVESTDVS